MSEETFPPLVLLGCLVPVLEMVVTGEVRICWLLASLVYGAPVLLLKGKVLGKPLPSARHTSVSLQRGGPGLGLM